VGLFSFLKKKNDAPEARAGARPSAAGRSTAIRSAARPAMLDPGSAFAPTTRMPLDTEAERERQREIARATAAKIDEIELQMTSDIFDDEGWAGSRRAPAAASSLTAGAAGAPPLDLNTADLLVEEGLPDAAAAPSSAPAIEEAAILYANGQIEAAEAALRSCLDSECRSERQPWWMLFDLYQASGREPAFESIAIDYASHFETSPPAYTPLAAQAANQPFSGVTPTATLSGQLDAAASAQLARVLASDWPIVRLEFSTIASATPEGCAALLAALQTLRRSGRELVVAGADHLAAVLRPMLAIGERGAGEAPWLLLLELLLLMNREKDFEETAMDYCVTFEVSPPSFEAPVRTALSVGATAGDAAAGDRFLLPGLVEGNSTALLDAIDAYAFQHAVLVLDCSRLARIDYAAAMALGSRLRQLAGGDDEQRSIELRDLNHLVAALLRLLGVGEHARLYAHKY
jgi:ABC-type transporter Mla MlaB component